MKRTNVTFLVPRKLPPGEASHAAALVHGVLRRDGARLVCDVTELKAVAGDLDRLEHGVKGLSARDAETRKAWARWAEKRARDFKNDGLARSERAKLEAEAFRIETAMKRLGVDAPSEWLAMAKDARRRRVPEPEPAALAHRALRAKLAAATDVAELEETVQEIEKFFPGGRERAGGGPSERRAVGRAVREGPGGGVSRRSRERPKGVRPPVMGRCQRTADRHPDDGRSWCGTGPCGACHDASTGKERTRQSTDREGRRPGQTEPGHVRQPELKELAEVMREQTQSAGRGRGGDARMAGIPKESIERYGCTRHALAGRCIMRKCLVTRSQPWSYCVKPGESTRIRRRSRKPSGRVDIGRSRTNGLSRGLVVTALEEKADRSLADRKGCWA